MNTFDNVLLFARQLWVAAMSTRHCINSGSWLSPSYRSYRRCFEERGISLRGVASFEVSAKLPPPEAADRTRGKDGAPGCAQKQGSGASRHRRMERISGIPSNLHQYLRSGRKP